MHTKPIDIELTFADFREEVLHDFRMGWLSRYVSILGKKEVFRGRAKFGIMGAGKELPQLALCKFFKNGDFRSGYYRDQTIALVTGAATVQQMFSLLYSDVNLAHEPSSAGRQMSSHFSSRLLDEHGNFKSQLEKRNHSADSAPTGSQMGRAVGLGFASKLYRNHYQDHPQRELFTNNGNEIVFANIGDASTSEGIFFETVNAIGVNQLPVVLSVWDDGFGISVPTSVQTTKSSISEALAGFQRTDEKDGFEILTVNGWDYPALVATYQRATTIARKEHVPVLVHVKELTQPQGHSSSGSHERYKDDERLAFEDEYDCLLKMEQWMLANGIIDEEQVNEIKEESKQYVKAEMKRALDLYLKPGQELVNNITDRLSEHLSNPAIENWLTELQAVKEPKRSVVDRMLRELQLDLRRGDKAVKETVENLYLDFESRNEDLYHSYLFTESSSSHHHIQQVKPVYADDAEKVNGFQLLRACFDSILENNKHVLAFGEDLGEIGGVNQCFAGLQDKHGEHRVFDVGIREGTIVGKAMGLAMRGFKPIAEIQYLDYLLFGLQQLSDEIATLSYRTKRGQKAPVIIRTRGHRLEGIWHTGSPMGMIVNSLRGVHVLVPRNMTQAAGFYNTLVEIDEPAILVEVLNAYRYKETMPSNISELRLPLGLVETIRSGTDLTLVTYGACVKVAMDAAERLDQLGISVEVIDVQSLLPFDLAHDIAKSVQKTNRLVVLDEDVPGGASAYIMQHVLEEQKGYMYLDSAPITITASAHRVGYGGEYDHFSKPQPVDVVERVYYMMHDANPEAFPSLH